MYLSPKLQGLDRNSTRAKMEANRWRSSSVRKQLRSVKNLNVINTPRYPFRLVMGRRTKSSIIQAQGDATVTDSGCVYVPTHIYV